METIGPLQLRVMHYLWSQGPATVHAVQEHINAITGERPLAYTTILTVMRNLVRRHYLSQTPQGRSHLFTPLINERAYKFGMLRHLRQDLFGGDVNKLVEYLIADDEIPAAMRDQLRATVKNN
jgi:BlaI family transcriptional regulator, penicillinase repressor